MLLQCAHAQSLTGVQSRKTHALGNTTFDLPLHTGAPIAGAITFESREIGTGHTIVFQFDSPITQAGNASALDIAAAPVGVASALINPANPNEVLITLTGIADNKRVTVSLDNVNGNSNRFDVSVGFRIGDSDNSGTVTLPDISRIKVRSGQPTGASSYAYDLNVTGQISAADVAAAKKRSGLLNAPPVVSAGGSQTIALPAVANLSGTASDDGLPNPPGALTFAWSRFSGPFTVTFGDANALTTTAIFAGPGSYVLRLTANDGAASGTSDVSITVNPGPAAVVAVSGLASPIAAGTAGSVTITLRDAFNNIATGYRGTVHFTSSDPAATLPANYTFTAIDNGVHVFAVTLNTVGTQSVTVTDTGSGSLTGSQTGVSVTSAALPGLFEKPNPWNKDLSILPVSPRSAAITSALISMGGWGNGNKLQIDFSIPVMYADNTTPRGTISAAPGYYLPDGDATPLQMPLPFNGNTEGSPNDTYSCDTANNDCHVLVVERAQKRLYELYNATGTASAMTALGAYVWDLTKQYSDVLRGEQCTSADAAGLPMAALIPTSDEVAAGEVPHAIRFILPNPRMKAGVYVHPATHAGGPSSANPDAPPYGVRFRLKASFDEMQPPFNTNPAARIILRAMKKYGMVLSDGGNIALTFADDRLSTAKWATLGITAQTFNGIGVGNFEVVDLGNEIVLTYDCIRAP